MSHGAEKDVPVLPEDWCHHHPEMTDNAGRCQHPGCTVAGPQVRPTSPAETRAESDPHATNGRVSTAQIADGDSA